MTEAILAGLGVAAGRDRRGERRHGARARCRWCRSRGSTIAIIGFDALPEALASVRDGGLLATIEQMPGGQSRQAHGRDGRSSCARATKPEPLVLLTPIAITKDNLDKAERLGEAS